MRRRVLFARIVLAAACLCVVVVAAIHEPPTDIPRGTGNPFDRGMDLDLREPLEFDLDASRMLKAICQRYDPYAVQLRRAKEREDRGETFDLELGEALLSVILRYPRSTSALTAQLRLCFEWPTPNERQKRAYQRLYDAHPHRWQGIAALSGVGAVLFYTAPKDPQRHQPAIQWFLSHMEEWKRLDLESDPEYLQIGSGRATRRIRKPSFASGSRLVAVAYYYEMDHQPVEALAIVERVIREYPGSDDADQARFMIPSLQRLHASILYREEFKRTHKRPPTFLEMDQWSRQQDRAK